MPSAFPHAVLVWRVGGAPEELSAGRFGSTLSSRSSSCETRVRTQRPRRTAGGVNASQATLSHRHPSADSRATRSGRPRASRPGEAAGPAVAAEPVAAGSSSGSAAEGSSTAPPGFPNPGTGTGQASPCPCAGLLALAKEPDSPRQSSCGSPAGPPPAVETHRDSAESSPWTETRNPDGPSQPGRNLGLYRNYLSTRLCHTGG